MTTVSGVIRNGQVHPSQPIKTSGQRYCLITIVEEDPDELRRSSEAMLEESKQDRLSALLKINKSEELTNEQEGELDALLTEVHQLAAKRARAARILQELRPL